MRLIALGLALGLGAPAPSRPQPPQEDVLGDVVVDATSPGSGGPRLLEVALRSFTGPAFETERVEAIVRRDLDLSGQFTIADAPTGGPAPIVTVEVARTDGGTLALRGAVFFDADAEVPAYETSVTGSTLALRGLTHELVDALIEVLTGHRGPFVSQLTMIVRRGGTRAVYALDPDGHGLRRISDEHQLAGDVALGPDDVPYYSASVTHGRFRVYRADQPEPLDVELPGSVYGIAFSQDRTRVALTVGVGPDVRLHVGAADFSDLAPVGGVTLALNPTFGPHGVLAVAGTRSGRSRIWVDDRPLSPASATASAPSFCDHPDGVRLVYARGGRQRSEIIAADARGRRTRVIVGGRSTQSAPECAPDGRLVAFFSNRRTGEGPGLYVVRVDGYHLRKVADIVGESLQWSRVSTTVRD